MESKAESAKPGTIHPLARGVAWSAALGPLLLLTAIFFLTFCARVIYAPLVPEIEKELFLSHAAAGSLFFFISVGYFLALLCSGWIAARIEHRNMIIASAVGAGLALGGSALAGSYASLAAGLLLVGAVTGLYLPSAIATLTSLIRPDHWGKAIAVHELAPNLGLVAVPLAAEWIMTRLPWRAVPVLVGVAALLAGLLFARYGRGGRFAGEAPKPAAMKAFLSDPAFWTMAALFGLGISGTLGIYTMLPLYLIADHGVPRADANLLVALSRISGIFMAMAGGWATDRFGPFRTMTGVFLATGLATVAVGIAPGRWAVAAMFVQTLPATCFFPAGFAALSSIGPPSARNIAVSLAVPLAFMFGGGIVPGLIGLFGDIGSFAYGFTLVGCLIACGAAAAWYQRLRLERTGRSAARQSPP